MGGACRAHDLRHIGGIAPEHGQDLAIFANLVPDGRIDFSCRRLWPEPRRLQSERLKDALCYERFPRLPCRLLDHRARDQIAKIGIVKRRARLRCRSMIFPG